jgi:hypothetical protein
MSEGDDLQFQTDAAAKTEGKQGKNGGSGCGHAGDDIGVEPITPCFLSFIYLRQGQVLSAHAPDQVPDVHRNRRPPAAASA